MARGRVLKAPRGASVRPTADRVKETIFNVLGQWLEGERVLDLFAGAGSLGLEALSRGAVSATFVERDREAVATLAANIRALGFAEAATTLQKPVERAVRGLSGSGESFTLVFSDPPYAARAAAGVLTGLAAAGILAPGARLVLEHDRREAVPDRLGAIERTGQRRFGDTLVTFYVLGSAPPP